MCLKAFLRWWPVICKRKFHIFWWGGINLKLTTFGTFKLFKNYVNVQYLQKVISKKLRKKNIFCWHLEGPWQKKQDPEQMRIRIRKSCGTGTYPRILMHTKMSRIYKTGTVLLLYTVSNSSLIIWRPKGLHDHGGTRRPMYKVVFARFAAGIRWEIGWGGGGGVEGLHPPPPH
jgi:hypothetical protein